MFKALLLSFLVGLPIFIGGFISSRKDCQKNEPDILEHAVMAFGGGALFSAISFVLVPKGIEMFNSMYAVIPFVFGGIMVAVVDKYLDKNKSNKSQLIAMLLDYIPESIVMGALFSLGSNDVLLLGFIIALQNFPEGYNAYKEFNVVTKRSKRKILIIFFCLSLLGPISACFGIVYFAKNIWLLGAVMLFCAGGILYLTFQDIAPRSICKHHYIPSLGAIFGFSLGIIGKIYLDS